MISINIFGHPISWKRPSHRILNGKVIVYDTQKKEKDQVRWQMKSYFQSQDLITCPCEIEMIFSFKPHTTTSKARRKAMINGSTNHFIKPDTDNCLKFYLDCLSGCVLYDDCIVYSLKGTKIYAEEEGTKININPRNLHPNFGPSTLLEDLDLPPDFLDEDKGDSDADY